MKTIARNYALKAYSEPEPMAIVELDENDLRRIGALKIVAGTYRMKHDEHQDPAERLLVFLEREREAAQSMLHEAGPVKVVQDALEKLHKYLGARELLATPPPLDLYRSEEKEESKP